MTYYVQAHFAVEFMVLPAEVESMYSDRVFTITEPVTLRVERAGDISESVRQQTRQTRRRFRVRRVSRERFSRICPALTRINDLESREQEYSKYIC